MTDTSLKSKIAGFRGFSECLFIRWFLPIAPMIITPIASTFMTKYSKLYRTNNRIKFVADVFMCYLALTIGVTGSISVFHPMGFID